MTIKRETLLGAISEAERFLKAAQTLKHDQDTNPARHGWEPSIHASACRRASMDLTRKLADLRQGR